MSNTEFCILLRKPIYPLIVISSDNLYSAFNIRELARNCMRSTIVGQEGYIKAIDSTGAEFCYYPEHCAITPGFLSKRWTKKQIVEMYNESSNSNTSEQKYSTKSLSAKRLEKVVSDICNLLK